MKLSDALIADVEYDAKRTRPMLENVPFDPAAYTPDAKSMSLREEAHHIADNPSWVEAVVKKDEHDEDASNAPFATSNYAELLAEFAQGLASAIESLRGVDDGHLTQPWIFKVNGNPIMTLPRVVMIQGFFIKHPIHHRAQLGVYLRLLYIPVPSIHGPCAAKVGY